MIYVGSSDKYLNIVSLNLGAEFKLFNFDPKKESLHENSTALINRALMQRYAMIEKVKNEESKVIGILVGSVVADQYMTLINQLKLTAVKSGKKYYEVLIGKLNEPKLKNF